MKQPITECSECEHPMTLHGYDCQTCEAFGIRGACEAKRCKCYWYQSIAELLELEDWRQEQWDGYRTGRLTKTGRERTARNPRPPRLP